MKLVYIQTDSLSLEQYIPRYLDTCSLENSTILYYTIPHNPSQVHSNPSNSVTSRLSFHSITLQYTTLHYPTLSHTSNYTHNKYSTQIINQLIITPIHSPQTSLSSIQNHPKSSQIIPSHPIPINPLLSPIIPNLLSTTINLLS